MSRPVTRAAAAEAQRSSAFEDGKNDPRSDMEDRSPAQYLHQGCGRLETRMSDATVESGITLGARRMSEALVIQATGMAVVVERPVNPDQGNTDRALVDAHFDVPALVPQSSVPIPVQKAPSLHVPVPPFEVPLAQAAGQPVAG
eukprot:jgi/Chrzof1/12385/Cz06g32160.t1